jgi:hypothetical protein
LGQVLYLCSFNLTFCLNMTYQTCFSIFLVLNVTWASSALFGQQSAFFVANDTVSRVAPADSSIIEAFLYIKNVSATTKSVRWQRSILALSDPSLLTLVCDPVQCWAASVSTFQFDLPADQTAPMSISFLNETGQAQCGIIRLKVFDANNPADSVGLYYLFNNCGQVLNDRTPPLPRPTATLSPNPTTAQFLLHHTEDANRMYLCDAQGRMLYTRPITPDAVFSLHDYPAGLYFVVLEDRYGRMYQAIEVNKQ